MQSLNHILQVVAALFLGALPAMAEVVRCEVTERTHKLMPEWIEYDVNAYGTAVAVRDSLGAQIGVDWVSGEITENTARRFTLMWDNGPMPQDTAWNQLGRVEMRLARLPDGSVHLTAIPTRAFRTFVFSGRATCSY